MVWLQPDRGRQQLCCPDKSAPSPNPAQPTGFIAVAVRKPTAGTVPDRNSYHLFLCCFKANCPQRKPAAASHNLTQTPKGSRPAAINHYYKETANAKDVSMMSAIIDTSFFIISSLASSKPHQQDAEGNLLLFMKHLLMLLSCRTAHD